MAPDYVRPVADPRIVHRTAFLNGTQYHYLLATPEGTTYRGTVFLVHGWPDLSIGWRYQIPMLLSMRYRVVCLDLMGFGGTDAPEVPPNSIGLYGFKRASDDIKDLAQQLNAPKVILGGHDWGGVVVYRVACWYPWLVSHIFTVCTPYHPRTKTFTPLGDLVATRLPNWAYQLQLCSGSVEEHIQTRDQIKQLLNAMYGAKTLDGRAGFNVEKGIIFDHLPKIGKTYLMDDDMMNYYVDEYARHGIHSTLNWYRTQAYNFDDEHEILLHNIEVPVLFIQAAKDAALPPALSTNMEHYCPKMRRRVVETGHWALWEAPEDVNKYIADWLDEVAKPTSNL